MLLSAAVTGVAAAAAIESLAPPKTRHQLTLVTAQQLPLGLGSAALPG
jgi:hypothetical protein